MALARLIAAEPACVAGRRVLDLGAGSGLVAIAAARAGAKSVLAAEIDPVARVALALNGTANGVSLQPCAIDIGADAPPAIDLVLAGDVYYERVLARRMTAFLKRCRATGIEVLVGDPGRAWLPLDLLQRIAAFEVADFGGGKKHPVPAAVYAFAPGSRQPITAQEV